MLANLFLHYALDAWMAREYPGIWFERYVDDGVVHCATRRQAVELRRAIAHRLAAVGLLLHPTKTKIVYCKDSRRRGSHEHTSFTFLGYTFRPRRARNSKTRENFTSFAPAISKDALKAKSQEVRRWRIHLRTTWTLDSLAKAMNPVVRGWMNYYGRFYRHEMYPLLRRINAYLVRWAQRKYERLRAFTRVKAWWRQVVKRDPALFAHWQWNREFWRAGGEERSDRRLSRSVLWEPEGETPSGHPTCATRAEGEVEMI